MSIRDVRDLVVDLARDRNWHTYEAIQMNTGIAASTLANWAKNQGGRRGDALGKITDHMDVPPRLIEDLRDGRISLEEAKAELGLTEGTGVDLARPGGPSPSLEYRLESLEDDMHGLKADLAELRGLLEALADDPLDDG